MAYFLTAGTMIGAVFGLLHAGSLYARLTARGDSRLRALYFALWTAVLWTLFGAYLLAFWLLGGLAMLISRLAGGRSPAPRANADPAP